MQTFPAKPAQTLNMVPSVSETSFLGGGRNVRTPALHRRQWVLVTKEEIPSGLFFMRSPRLSNPVGHNRLTSCPDHFSFLYTTVLYVTSHFLMLYPILIYHFCATLSQFVPSAVYYVNALCVMSHFCMLCQCSVCYVVFLFMSFPVCYVIFCTLCHVCM